MLRPLANVFIWLGTKALKISRDFTSLFVYLDAFKCPDLFQVIFHGKEALQISCDLLSSLSVYINVCNCQMFISTPGD